MRTSLKPAPLTFAAFDRGFAILLDLRRNRYWALPEASLAIEPISPAANALIEGGVLVRGEENALETWGMPSGLRAQPSFEQRVIAQRRQKGEARDFIRSCWLAACWVRSGRLDRARDGLARLRTAIAYRVPSSGLEERLARFEHLRPWWPGDRVCLFDSLALTLFLMRAGLRARVVFGVRASPFSAHCWVEAQGRVHCDLTGQALSYAPICRF